MQGVSLTFGQLNELCFNRSKLIELFDIVGISQFIKDNKSFYNIIDNIQDKLKIAVLDRHLKNDVANNVLTNCNIVNDTITITIEAKQNHILEDNIYNIVSNWNLNIKLNERNITLSTELQTDNINSSNGNTYKTKVAELTNYEFLTDGKASYCAYLITETIKNNANQYYGTMSKSFYDAYGIEYCYEEVTTAVKNIESLELLPKDILLKSLKEMLNQKEKVNYQYKNERIGVNLMHITIDEKINNKVYTKDFKNIINTAKSLQNLEKLYEPTYYNLMCNTELDESNLKNILAEPQNEMYAEGLMRYSQIKRTE